MANITNNPVNEPVYIGDSPVISSSADPSDFDIFSLIVNNAPLQCAIVADTQYVHAMFNFSKSLLLNESAAIEQEEESSVKPEL